MIQDARRKRLWVVREMWDYYPPWAPIFSMADSIEDAEVVLFAGGTDISPKLYGERNLGKSQQAFDDRDKEEVSEFKKLRSRGIPIIGICRGAQLVTALLGGKLYQHVDGHTTSHPMTTVTGERLWMSSAHHQMMRPPEEHELIAWTDHLSDEYHTENDVVKPDQEVDPEVVWYPQANALCIQGHPEYMTPWCDTNKYLRNLALQKFNFNVYSVQRA